MSDSWQDVQALAAHMKAQRAAREAEWLELSRWICPYRGVFAGEDLAPSGSRRNRRALIQPVTRALLRGASGMTSGMTPRNISWFEPDFDDPELGELSGARVWLDEVDRRMKAVLSAGGFYQAIQSFNTDLLWAGCALIYAEHSETSFMRFECAQVGSWWIAPDGEGRLEAVLRCMVWTPARLAQVFGRDRLDEGTRAKIEKEPYAAIRIWHLVRRRLPGEGGRAGLPWISYFWEDSSQDFLSVGGYNEMPYFFTVWHEGQTLYGTGPGDEALPDARQLNELERMKLRGLATLARPPVKHPASMPRPDLAPGGMTAVENMSDIIAPILDLAPFSHCLPALQAEIQTVDQRLEQSLMAAIFASIPLDQRPKDMSATEFLERKREALQQLGPVISAYEPNVLSPLLERLCACLDRGGLLPPPPPALEGLPLPMRMEFISPMANALRQTGAETTRALVADVLNMARASPDVLDKLDLDQAVDELATGLGAPGKLVRTDADVAAMRQQRAQMRQEAQAAQNQAMQSQNALTEAQALGQMAGAAKDIGELEQAGAGTV